MAWTRLPGTPIACASWFWLMPIRFQELLFENLAGMGITKLRHIYIHRFAVL